jgi:hypothetical protein
LIEPQTAAPAKPARNETPVVLIRLFIGEFIYQFDECENIPLNKFTFFKFRFKGFLLL